MRTIVLLAPPMGQAPEQKHGIVSKAIAVLLVGGLIYGIFSFVAGDQR